MTTPQETTPPRACGAQAYWATGPLAGEIRDVPLAEPGPGEVLVRTRFSGISRGTESIVARGAVPDAVAARMRCPFQDGSFPFPVKYGYAAVGVVEAGEAHLLGRNVFALFPHQTRWTVAAAAVHVVPDDVPPARAVLAANMETALNGLWDSGAAAGDRVVVTGAGVVGVLTAYLAARLPGAEVTVVEPDAARRGLARTLGLTVVDTPPHGIEADVVIEASGAPAALSAAMAMAGAEATVLCLGWSADRPVPLPLGEHFFARRLRLVASQVGQLPAQHRARWTHERRLRKALALLADPRLDRLVTGESPFHDLPRLMPELARAASTTLCHRIRYDDPA